MKSVLMTLAMQLVVTSAMAVDTFGSGDFSSEPVKLATILKNFDQYKDKKVVVSGSVKEVCAKEGCWMKIEDEKITVRAIMKNHGFKVPKEIQNKVVQIEGTLVQKELPANAVKHYMKDEGRPQEEIDKVDKPQKVFQFLAEAVKVG